MTGKGMVGGALYRRGRVHSQRPPFRRVAAGQWPVRSGIARP